jgi:2-succinyl-5-enolpyruvyl-6-hydroxy-3-cyclohexene-1-carboxylate synthase
VVDDAAPLAPDPPGGTPDVGVLNATFAATLVDEWVRGGVSDAVVCPGSRSTPLALALAADGRIRVHVHHDERAGAFLALGLGRALGRPAVVLTTSGTAAVELHPAVVEADLDRVPLLAVTADRPPELRDVGAPQTVDQQHLFGRAPRWFADPGPPDAAAEGTWRSVAARSVLEAVGPRSGPVHLNLPFREPLHGSPAALPPGRSGGAAWHARPPGAGVSGEQIEAVAACLRPAAARGLIVVGGAVADPAGVLALADAWGWPVVADPRSGCRVEHPLVVAHADAVLRVDGPRRDATAVLRLGTIPASKVVAKWSAASTGPQVVVEAGGAWLDPHRTAALLVAAEPGALARGLAGVAEPASADPGWSAGWRAADDAVAAVMAAELDGEGPVTEPGTARAVAAAVPPGGSLVVSSSMPVRDVEWFAGSLPGVTVHANRGANGIDGVVSTAVGVALAGAPTVTLVGDVALLHDTNALLGLAGRDVDLVVVVVDNDGGGIFSFLPQAAALDADRFEQLFGTPHGVDLGRLAAAHHLALRTIDTAEAVGPAVARGLAAGGVHLLRVVTDRARNVEVHERLQTAAGAAVRAACGEVG